MKKIAKYFEKLSNNRVKCTLCPHQCILSENQIGFCKVRKNVDGNLYTLNYGTLTAIAMDPIEKKPLYHFYPASNILSIGSMGCNLRCPYCQNYEISNADLVNYSRDYTPENIVNSAIKNRSFGIAYTYNEPTVFYDFVLDTSIIAHNHGIKNVWVTNGNIELNPLKEIAPYMDAVNIDLKSMNENFYSRFVKGNLQTTKNTIEFLYKNNVHIEITFLVITNKNDSEEEIRNLTQFIAKIDPHIPLHISRYFPQYKINEPPTPQEILNRNYRIAREYLKFVYIGNVVDFEKSNTYCPQCGTLLIERHGYFTKSRMITNRCPKCGEEIYGHFHEQL